MRPDTTSHPGPGRDIRIHEIEDISQVDEQVSETQVPLIRPEG
jgi:hypothetical protein